MKPKLSVVIPTKDEEKNIGACIKSLRCSAAQAFDLLEITVVDNFSSDRTRDIAAELGANVLLKGPERCAQRNRGWRESTGDWVLFLDADMTLPEATLAEIAEKAAGNAIDAYFIPEVRDGQGLRAKARNFERQFYDGTCIDGLRLIRRKCLERVAGYDEKLVACEDWDLDRRLMLAGAQTDVLAGHLVHHEALVPLKKLLEKKAYYSGSVGAYRAKWKEDVTIRKQFGLFYRYLGVFVEDGKWRRLVRHPILAAVMMFERVLIGFTYIRHR